MTESETDQSGGGHSSVGSAMKRSTVRCTSQKVPHVPVHTVAKMVEDISGYTPSNQQSVVAEIVDGLEGLLTVDVDCTWSGVAEGSLSEDGFDWVCPYCGRLNTSAVVSRDENSYPEDFTHRYGD